MRSDLNGMLGAVPDFIYSVHGQLFHMPRKAFDVVPYTFVGLYMIAIMVFFFVPYVALRIVERK